VLSLRAALGRAFSTAGCCPTSAAAVAAAAAAASHCLCRRPGQTQSLHCQQRRHLALYIVVPSAPPVPPCRVRLIPIQ
jgi:hypothetical protein